MSYAGAAANVAGGEISGWAAVLAKQAMADAYKQELGRQQAFRTQALGVFNAGLPMLGVEQAGKDMQAGGERRQQFYGRVGATPLASSIPTQQSASPTRDEANANMLGGYRAKLGSYSDWALTQAMRTLANQRQLDQVTNFAHGTAGVFPYRMYDAQHSQDDLAMIGAAISSIGGGAANYQQFAQAPQGGGGGGGGGGGYPQFSQQNGFWDSYGNYYPPGWNNMGGAAEGTLVPG